MIRIRWRTHHRTIGQDQSFRTGYRNYSESAILDNLSSNFHSIIIKLALSFQSFNSGYLYQVVVRIPLRFARAIRPGSGRRLGRAYGARPSILEIVPASWTCMDRPSPCPRPAAHGQRPTACPACLDRGAVCEETGQRRRFPTFPMMLCLLSR